VTPARWWALAVLVLAALAAYLGFIAAVLAFGRWAWIL